MSLRVVVTLLGLVLGQAAYGLGSSPSASLWAPRRPAPAPPAERTPT